MSASDIPADVLEAARTALLGIGHDESLVPCVARAILAERERCAAICDAFADDQDKTVRASAVARAIRKGSV